MRRLGRLGPLAVLAALALAPSASAHALTGREDLPIPAWLFGWAAVLVLVVSFVALGALWKRPQLERSSWRALKPPFDRLLSSLPVQSASGAIGVFLLGVVVWSSLEGADNVGENFAPTFVFVVFWVGMVPVSVLFGNVYKAFNPWRACGRAVGWASYKLPGHVRVRPPLDYPERLGRWPAAVGLFAFAWLELVDGHGAEPRNLAVATLLYTGLTFTGMILFGVDRWTERGEAFSVYYGLFARLSVWETQEGRLGLRRPLSGLAGIEPLPGTIEFVAVMIGATTFDGFESTPLWRDTVEPWLTDTASTLGLGNGTMTARAVGLIAGVSLVLTLYALGLELAQGLVRLRGVDLQSAFIHSLVPIALAYVSAHYFTLLIFQGQAIAYLASDPLGQGWNLFGTAGSSIDYGFIGATAIWYWQVGFVVGGHVLGLTSAHDRALTLYERAQLALRSQYPMLIVMVAFTTIALWLLSQANA